MATDEGEEYVGVNRESDIVEFLEVSCFGVSLPEYIGTETFCQVRDVRPREERKSAGEPMLFTLQTTNAGYCVSRKKENDNSVGHYKKAKQKNLK